MPQNEYVSNVKFDLFIDKITEEMEEFKLLILQKSKQEIYEANYEIYFYENVSDFLVGYGMGKLYNEVWDSHVVELIKRDNIISSLWDYYINAEYMSINSYEDICDFISTYVQTTSEELI
jgi:hypothetical protein